MALNVDKKNPDWAGELAEQVEAARAGDVTSVSSAFAHLGPLIMAVRGANAEVGAKYRVMGLDTSLGPAVVLSQADASRDVLLYRTNGMENWAAKELPGAMSLAAIPDDRLEQIQLNLAVLVGSLEDALIAKAGRLLS